MDVWWKWPLSVSPSLAEPPYLPVHRMPPHCSGCSDQNPRTSWRLSPLAIWPVAGGVHSAPHTLQVPPPSPSGPEQMPSLSPPCPVAPSPASVTHHWTLDTIPQYLAPAKLGTSFPRAWHTSVPPPPAPACWLCPARLLPASGFEGGSLSPSMPSPSLRGPVSCG